MNMWHKGPRDGKSLRTLH